MVTKMTTQQEGAVWELKEGEIRQPGIVHVVMTALFTGVGIVVGALGSLSVPLGFISAFWPGQAIQAVGSIWYGMWGGIAAAVFPLIANSLSAAAPLPVSIAYMPGNFAQGIIGGWAFRFFKADPSLKTSKSWLVFTFGAIIVPNIIGGAWGSTVLRMFGLITPAAHLVTFAGWVVGNSVASWVLGAILLRFVSPLVIRTKAFCKKYWA